MILNSSPVITQSVTTGIGGGCRANSRHGDGRHGELFYATFKSSISEFLVSVAADAVEHLTVDDAVIETRQAVIASVLTSMLDVVGHDVQLRHRYNR